MCSPWRSKMAVQKSLASDRIGEPDVRISVVAISRLMFTSRFWRTSAAIGSYVVVVIVVSPSDRQPVVAVLVEAQPGPRWDPDGGVDVLHHRRAGQGHPGAELAAPVDRHQLADAGVG